MGAKDIVRRGERGGGRQERCALARLEEVSYAFNAKLRKGKFIFAVAKRVGRKARRDNFRATVQATARIGILVPLRVYACMPCTSRAIYACVYRWSRVCVSSQSSMDAPDCLVGRYDGYTTAVGLRLCTRSPSLFHVAPSVLLLSCPILFFASAFVSSRVDTYFRSRAEVSFLIFLVEILNSSSANFSFTEIRPFPIPNTSRLKLETEVRLNVELKLR